MRSQLWLAIVAGAKVVTAQQSLNGGEFVDSATGIRFVNATVDRFSFGVALPSREWNLDFIGRLSGHEIGWGGIALGPAMTRYALIGTITST